MNEDKGNEKLQESCICESYVHRAGVHLPSCPAYRPTIEELEKAIGTPDELDILPDGRTQPKHKSSGVLLGKGENDFKEDCFALRAQIQETKVQTLLVSTEHPEFKAGFRTTRKENCITQEYHQLPEGAGEMRANLDLAYRHLEDAKMRLGKAIEAFEGGKSCYPR